MSAQPSQIGTDRFGTWQHYQIGGRWRFRSGDETKIDFGMQPQWIKIIVIRDPGIGWHDDFEARNAGFEDAASTTILGIKIKPLQIRQYPENWLTRMLFQPIKARSKNGQIAAKAVDHETDDALALAGRKQFQSADQVCKYPAPVDVRDQQYRAISCFRKTHIGDVVITQINLGRTARTLDH